MSFMEKLFGNFSDKELKRIKPIANKVLELEPEMQKLTDEELQAHFSNPTARDTESGKSKRVYPAEGDGYDYTPFVSAVKNAGYDGRISIEAGCTDFEKESAAGLKMMRKLFG